ncbi:MAG: hypothetical protein H5T76_22055 [Streptomyces sp.]|nr:hypothetical protein [Streptomyces sp.]
MTDFRVEVARRCQDLNVSRGLPRDAAVEVSERARIRTQVATQMFTERHGRGPLGERELAGFIARESRPRTTGKCQGG